MTPTAPPSPAHVFNAPVAVQSCRVEVDSAGGPMSRNASEPLIAGVEVRFVDRSPLTATEVVFRIAAAHTAKNVVDRGKFSPGVPIYAVFYDFSGRDYWRPEPDECDVVRVRFSDGTVWRPEPHLR